MRRPGGDPRGPGSSGSSAPPRKSSPSSPSSSRRRKNQTSQTIRAPTSKTRSPTMKIHPSSVTSTPRLRPSPSGFQPPVYQLARDRQRRRQPQGPALAHRVFDRFPGEPAHVLELLVALARLDEAGERRVAVPGPARLAAE